MSVAKRAAMMIKMIRLARSGLDSIAIKLNCEPNFDELREAERWQRAFALAADETRTALDLAMELANPHKAA